MKAAVARFVSRAACGCLSKTPVGCESDSTERPAICLYRVHCDYTLSSLVSPH